MRKKSCRLTIITTLVLTGVVVTSGYYFTHNKAADDVKLMVARIIEAHPTPTPVLKDSRWEKLEQQYQRSVTDAVEANRPYPDDETKKVIELMRERNHNVARLMNVPDIDAIIRKMKEEQSQCDEKDSHEDKPVACNKRQKYYFYPAG